MSERPGPAVIVISGLPGAGKSTLAPLLAQRLERAVYLEADVLQRMIVSGGVWPDAEMSEEPARQLRLRGRNMALLADSFVEAGFDVVIDDIVIGTRLADLRSDLSSRPLYFVLLLPDPESMRQRNAGRPDKDVFHAWKHLDEVARTETPRVGLWLDTSGQTAEQSLREIEARLWQEARIE